VVAAIPFITQTPYLTSALELVLEYRITFERLKSKTGIGARDYVRRSALPIIDNILRNNAPVTLPDKCPQTTTFYPLPPAPCILREGEAAKLNERTRAYNAIIKAETDRVDGLLVDTNQFVSRINALGYVVGKERLTTRFRGGLFSLDGVHPSHTGYAIVANYFIEKMNARFGLRMKPVSIEQVWDADPLRRYAITLPASWICLLGWCNTDDIVSP